MPGRWQTSDRRAYLPPDWNAPDGPRARCLHRDPTCRCPGCPRCSPTGCTRPSTDADHLGARTDHRPEMLAGKCSSCHLHKSSTDGGRAAAQRRRRPQQPHPGLLTP